MSQNEILFVRSSKKNSIGEGSSTNDDDIWDDSILIETYDRAVQLAQQNFLKKQSGENSGGSKVKKKDTIEHHKWKVGDKVRCQYSEDLNYYEADIISILGSSGMCVVKYVGYENEEKVSLKKLKPSEGESARMAQIQESVNDNENQHLMDTDFQNVEAKQQPSKKKFSSKKKGHPKAKQGYNDNNLSLGSINFPFPQLGNGIIPPPPPPHMFNSLGEDENETEAMSAMLISWYMSGYHTGYYQGLKMAKKL